MKAPHTMWQDEGGDFLEEYNCYCPLDHDHDFEDQPDEPEGVDWLHPQPEA